MNLRIRDLVDVPPVQTVIRLDDGASDARTITSSFVCTEDVTNHFTMLGFALQRETGGGFFLEGDFGSGKSHFLAAFSAWLDDRAGAGILSAAVPALGKCKEHKLRFLPVEISLVKFRSGTPIERIITSAVESALAAHGFPVTLSPLARFRERLAGMLATPAIAEAFRKKYHQEPAALEQWFSSAPREAYSSGITFLKEQGIEDPEGLVEERHEVFGRALDEVRKHGFSGMVIVIDELSEFFRSKPDAASLNEDARTLQLLGEIASSRPLWIIAAVQESIERTGDIASATFRKIKDRFPVRFHLSTLHLRDLIGRRLVKHKKGADEQILGLYNEYRRHFPRFSCPLDHFLKIYPIHPETLSLLEGLGDLFSQHRGIVDFVHARLAGDPARAIPGILDAPADELLAPDAIYEHFAPRLAEVSSFYIYPRQIIPHLDETINRVIEGDKDRALARRLVRMLVLYTIHPTAEKPTARRLAELSSCMLASHDPDVNVAFVTGVLLDPLVAQSRFLARRPSPSGDPLDSVYAVTAQEDYSGILRKRLEKALDEIRSDDSRLILEPLAALPSDMAWPGPEVLHEGIARTVTWRQTVRHAVVAFVQNGSESAAAEKITRSLDTGQTDFAVAIIVGSTPFSCRHTAVWRFGGKTDGGGVLAEWFAAKAIAAELHPSNPSHSPLIPLVNDLVRRTGPLVRTVLMDLVYHGSFDGESIMVDPSAVSVQRFDRLLEAAAEKLLEDRYPRFKEIAPRFLQPSSRLYQRIVDEFVCPGTLSLSEARARSLTDAIETLVAPLGLVEVKSGSYRLAPAIGEHPFLNYVFSLLSPVGPTPLQEILSSLRTGQWGVPRETAEFLLLALAHSGAVTLMRSGRTVSLDLLPVTSVETIETVSPGEIISQADRETLTGQCRFLSPQGGWTSFGLRQQREAWQALIKMKTSFQPVLDETAQYLSQTAQFEAFASLDFESISKKGQSLAGVFLEVKVSYQAREGLERFLAAWRASRLCAADVDRVKQAHRFFSRLAEKFIYVAHYLKHQSIDAACRAESALAGRRDAVLLMLKDPMNLVLPDEGVQLGVMFDLFREEFALLYLEKHREFGETLKPAALSRQEHRMAALFEKLSRIEPLDRPPGLEDLLRTISGGGKTACNRSVSEELLRSPACGCGFIIGDHVTVPSPEERAQTIDRCFTDYCAILASPGVLEALSARTYALRDMDPGASDRLERLCGILREAETRASTPVLDLLDDRTIAEIGRALSGTIKVQGRSLGKLMAGLAGRRLTPGKVQALFDDWTGSVDDDTLLSFDSPVSGDSVSSPPKPLWWPLLHPDLMPGIVASLPAAEARILEKALDEQFPSAHLEKQLARLDDNGLLGFIIREPLHTQAIRSAWTLFMKRALSNPGIRTQTGEPSRHCVAQEAAAISGRMRSLFSFLAAQNTLFPARLCGRIHASELWADDWSTRDLRKSLESAIAAMSDQAVDWLTTLAPQEVIDLREAPAVIIVDALPPDVWLDVSAQLAPLISGAGLTWSRLASSPATVPSLAALFGFPGDTDPFDEFAAAGAVYHSVKGDESHPLTDLLPPVERTTPLVVRISLLDNAAHAMNMPLHTLPQTLRTLLTRHLPGIIAMCGKQDRRLILTADHGLSWKSGRLSHGQGGVFEEAVVRVEWKK